jgi:hypothetical protein
LQAGRHQLQSFLEGGGTGKAKNVRGHAAIVVAGDPPDDLGGDILRVVPAASRSACHG